jgi:uncharacterized protein (DUF2132 family)
MQNSHLQHQHSEDPLHGVTLESILNELVEKCGWELLGQEVAIRCFTVNPTIKSSLKFLRRTPWARDKVEALYIWYCRQGTDTPQLPSQ